MSNNLSTKSCMLDDDTIRELIDIFIDTTTSELSALRFAVTCRNTQKVSEIAHSIKGAAANMGFEDIYMAARSLEQRAHHKNLAGTNHLISIMNKELGRIVQGKEATGVDFQPPW